MSRAALVTLALAACEPGWGYQARLRDPADRPVEAATLAVACAPRSDGDGFTAMSSIQRTDASGRARWIDIGAWPADCDLFIAKPGYRTQRLRATDLCPAGEHCSRVFDFDLVLEPEVPR